jgi:hypothetical protein
VKEPSGHAFRHWEDPISIDDIEAVENWEVKDVRRLADDLVLVECWAEVAAGVSGYMSKFEYWSLEEEGATNLELLDSDWNDHYVWIGMHLHLTVEVSLVLDQRTGVVQATEVNDVSESE